MSYNIASYFQKNTADLQASLREGDRVYLYGDTNYTGRLIRPIEGTYSPKWTVQLDHRGYEAVNVSDISLVESNSDIPFSDVPEPSYAQLKREIAALKKENALLQEEKENLQKDLDRAKQVIRRAKDVSPVMRLSLKRVLRLAHHACMDVQRTVGGWILKMGDKARRFRRLADIWDLISQDEFLLSDIFPEDKLVAIDSILPPRPRKRPTPSPKHTFPLIRPEEVLRRRKMGMPIVS